MNMYEFEKSIEKLERAFKPLSKNEDERSEKIEEYYSRLKYTDEYILNKAVIHLQDNYEYRSFPLIADILKAIRGVKESMRKEYHPGENECEHCQGTGWLISDCTDELGKIMHYNQARPCPYCDAGKAVKNACKIHDAKTGRQKYRIQLKKTATELTDNLPDKEDDFLSG